MSHNNYKDKASSAHADYTMPLTDEEFEKLKNQPRLHDCLLRKTKEKLENMDYEVDITSNKLLLAVNKGEVPLEHLKGVGDPDFVGVRRNEVIVGDILVQTGVSKPVRVLNGFYLRGPKMSFRKVLAMLDLDLLIRRSLSVGRAPNVILDLDSRLSQDRHSDMLSMFLPMS